MENERGPGTQTLGSSPHLAVQADLKSPFSLSPTQSTRGLSGPLGIYSTEGN